jgi:hypothetical protein
MKKILYIFTALLFLISSQSASAKIWRVNNNTNVVADFTTLQAAHDGATSGDTIHLEASPTSYGGLTCTKKLIILGAGFFLNDNPNTQAMTYTSRVDAFTLNVGSAGSVIMGLDFLNNSLNIFSHDIVIRRNKFTNPANGLHDNTMGSILLQYLSNNSAIPVNNIVISQNYGVKVDVNYASTGLLITNNYMGYNANSGDATTSACLSLHANAVALVQNNIFRRGTITAYNSSFTNNIMINGFFAGTGNLVSNNIASGEQFGTANGNKANISMSTVFVGTGTGISTDGQWKLKAGSPAIGAGYGHTADNPVDAGIFSGSTPYVLAGQPSMPAIYFFENQPVGSNADPVDVIIKVKSAGN